MESVTDRITADRSPSFGGFGGLRSSRGCSRGSSGSRGEDGSWPSIFPFLAKPKSETPAWLFVLRSQARGCIRHVFRDDKSHDVSGQSKTSKRGGVVTPDKAASLVYGTRPTRPGHRRSVKSESSVMEATGSTKFEVITYWPAQFHALRRLLYGADGNCCFPESLSRCVRWAVHTGRSGASFVRTEDGRLVIKVVPRNEFIMFRDNSQVTCRTRLARTHNTRLDKRCR